jgi:hypothetical protein
MGSILFSKARNVINIDPQQKKRLDLQYAEGALNLEQYRENLFKLQQYINEKCRARQKLLWRLAGSIFIALSAYPIAFGIFLSHKIALLSCIIAFFWCFKEFGDKG